MNNETKETISNAADTLETISCKIATVSELAALALGEICRHSEMGTVETLLNAVIDLLDYQSDEILCWARKLDHIGRSEKK